MKTFVVEFWKEWNDEPTDFYEEIEARNAEEAIEIIRHREPCGKHFKAQEKDG